MVMVWDPMPTLACAGGLSGGLLSFCAKAEELTTVAAKNAQHRILPNFLRCI
jgi:hypothetical protein